MEVTQKQTEEQRVPPIIRMKGLTPKAYEFILVEQAKLNAKGPRIRHIGEVAGLCLNKFVEENK